jgi:nucleotide-binding universal stress UspA family protein
MFKRLVICTDLSPASDALIQCAEELKCIGVEEVILTHVINPADSHGFADMLVDESRSIIESQKNILEDHGIRVIVEMPFGLSAHAIVETAEQHDVSAILTGSHGKGILQSALLGSISAQLLHLARYPVLLARISLLEDGKCEAVCGRMFSNVLFPTDFSEKAERVLDYLVKINRDNACPVTVMHVMEQKTTDQPDSELSEEESRFLLEAKMRRLSSLGISDVNCELVRGNPAEEIINRTKGGGFSIVVMGGQGKGFIKEFFLGSVANEVSRRSEIPVLFIPAEPDLTT